MGHSPRHRASAVFHWASLGGVLAIGLHLIGLESFHDSIWYSWWPHSWPSLYAEKIGEALVVAFVLAVGVDGWVKRRLIREVAEELSPLIVGNALPKDLRAEVSTQFATPILRANMALRISVEFAEAQDGTRHLVFTNKIAHEVLNVTTAPQWYEMLGFADGSSAEGVTPATIQEMLWEVEGLQSEASLPTEVEPETGWAICQERVLLPGPNPKNPDEASAKCWTTLKNAFFAGDTVTFNFTPTHPIRDFTIEVIPATDVAEQYHFTARFVRPLDRVSMTKPHLAWQYRGIMLAGQGLRLVARRRALIQEYELKRARQRETLARYSAP